MTSRSTLPIRFAGLVTLQSRITATNDTAARHAGARLARTLGVATYVLREPVNITFQL